MNGTKSIFSLDEIPSKVFYNNEDSKELFITICKLIDEKKTMNILSKVVFVQASIEEASNMKTNMYLILTKLKAILQKIFIILIF